MLLSWGDISPSQILGVGCTESASWTDRRRAMVSRDPDLQTSPGEFWGTLAVALHCYLQACIWPPGAMVPLSGSGGACSADLKTNQQRLSCSGARRVFRPLTSCVTDYGKWLVKQCFLFFPWKLCFFNLLSASQGSFMLIM